MNVRHVSTSTAVLAAALIAAPVASAGILDLDINGFQSTTDGGNGEGPTQTDFDSLAVEDGTASPVSGSFGGIDVTITAVDTSTATPTFTARNRADRTDGTTPDDFPAGLSETDLHQDWITGGNDIDDSTLGDEGLDILIEGLPASTSLTVTLWSYEAGESGTDQGNSQNYSDWFIDDGDGSFSATSDTLAQDNWEVINFGDFDEDSDGRFTITGSTNSSGEMLIFARGGAAAGVNGQTLPDANGKGAAFLNGIQIIPEPASLALVGLGGLVMLHGRRRRD